ncbi:MAG: dienelactone hydrolase family protein [Acidobacteriota bacterium]|nr:dienelactone hydrolase family protein [Acidobacteriota bacterium]
MTLRMATPVAAAAVLALVMAGPAAAQMDHSMHAAMERPPAAAGQMADNPKLPAMEQTARARLDHSPRHGEWDNVTMADGSVVKTWVSYPEVSTKAPVVIVIHEIFGLSDWIRSVADQLAAEGFVAVAPDLISGKGPNGGGSDSVDRDGAVKLVSALPRDVVNSRLDAVRAWALKLPAADGQVGVVGFCWGGTSSFAYAAHQPGLGAAVVYYGTSPTEDAQLEAIKAPVLAFYGGSDARVGATVPATTDAMKRLGKWYEPHMETGAGHGFLRAQDGMNGANMRATEQAWPRTIAFFKANLK